VKFPQPKSPFLSSARIAFATVESYKFPYLNLREQIFSVYLLCFLKQNNEAHIANKTEYNKLANEKFANMENNEEVEKHKF